MSGPGADRVSSSPPPDAGASAPALKDMFDATRFRAVARLVSDLEQGFDSKRFLTFSLDGLEPLSLMQRLRRMTEALHASLPGTYRQNLAVLKKLAPQIDKAFITLVLPDYVALHGLDDFAASMEALKFFTVFGSAEFAVRPFLKQDLPHTLAVMETWSRDENEHVRRLASEGCRPRLPWSFQLDAILADPDLVAPILENLKSDPSLYVRKSVANHLNDHTKKHPDWVLEKLSGWPLENPRTAWIARHALRTLIKKGDARALALTGATPDTRVSLQHLAVQPERLHLGERLDISFQLTSLAPGPQRLVVDYAVHYVKKSGGTSAKVFKLKEVDLPAGETLTLSRSQVIRDFTTRTHHPGRHVVEIMVNGTVHGQAGFELLR